MRDVVRGVFAAVVFLLVAGALAERSGWMTVTIPRPHGTGAWMIARASGVIAFVALGLEVIAGLIVSTKLELRWLPRAVRADLHRWLSPVVLALVAGHAVVLLADDYVRFDAIDVLVPFTTHTRTAGVSLGVLALYLLVVVHVSFTLRRRIGPATWRRLHYLSFVSFVASALHVVATGTDIERAWFATIIALPIVLVAALVAVRFRRASSGAPDLRGRRGT